MFFIKELLVKQILSLPGKNVCKDKNMLFKRQHITELFCAKVEKYKKNCLLKFQNET